MADKLHSTDHHITQQALYALLLEKIPDAKVKDATHDLIALIDANKGSALFRSGEIGKRVEAIMTKHTLSPQQCFELTHMLTLVTHLARASTITAANTELAQQPSQQEVHKLIDTLSGKKGGKALAQSQIVALINQVTMENVFTAHPTYIGDLDYSKMLCQLDRQIAAGESDAIGATLGALVGKHALVDKRFSAQDETAFMTHYLEQAFESLPTICRQYDDAFKQANMAAEKKDYDPLSLNLDLNFRSWGSSGDKDGNKNITYHSLADAITSHRSVAIGHYRKQLQTLAEAFRDDPRFTARFQFLLGELSSLEKSPTKAENRGSLLQKSIRALAHDVYQQYPDHDHPIAKQALDLYRQVNVFGLGMGTIEFRETADVLQFVLDRVITKDVIDQALQPATASANHYSALSEDEKTKVLNVSLSKSVTAEALKAQIAAAERAIPEVPADQKDTSTDCRGRQFEYADTGKGKANTGIFIHTIKRLELAQQNPDMFKSQVLAEAEHPNQIKEMMLLLKATGTEKQLRIIPLFEDPEVLAKLETKGDQQGIMDLLHHDPYMFRHLVDISLVEWDEKVARGLRDPLPDDIKQSISKLADIMAQGHGDFSAVEDEYTKAKDALEETLHTRRLPPLREIIHTQSQLAHSDNTRRGGMAGARAGIYKAHRVIRNSAGDLGIGAQMYEGGSHTDSFRMGVRSYRSLVNLYNNHHFMKATVQGMDLAQLFSSPATIESFIQENICNAAHKLHERSPHGHISDSKAALYVNRGIMEQDVVLKTVIDEVQTYRNDFFGGSGKEEGHPKPNIILGNIIAQVFNYEENSKAGTLGSRSGGRSSDKDQKLYLNPVTDTRTIGYSETFQHGSLNPNFIGAGRLFNKLLSEKLYEATHPHTEKGYGRTGAFRSQMLRTEDSLRLQKLYLGSPILRDVIDRAAYAVATTNFDTVWDNALYDYSSGTKQKRTLTIGDAKQIKDGTSHTETIADSIPERPKPSELAALAQDKDKTAAGFLAWMELEYRNAALMVIKAIMPEKLEPGLADTMDFTTVSTREIAATVRDILPMYQEMMARQDVMMETANYISHTIPRSVREETYAQTENGLNKSLHNLRDMATLVRPPFRSELRNQRIIDEHTPDRLAGMAI